MQGTVRQDIGNVSNVRRNGGGTTRGNVWGDVGFASSIVTPPSYYDMLKVSVCELVPPSSHKVEKKEN